MSNQKRILLVEDSLEAGTLVCRTFGPSVQIEWVKSLGEATRALRDREFDLVLLDVQLPDGDGYQFCSLLQTEERWRNVPVIMLTSRSSISDRVMAFSVGAEDFLAKPFDSLELKARVEARLRKKEMRSLASDVVVCSDLEINKRTQKVNLNANGSSQEIDLTPREFKILLLLASKPNAVVSRDEILRTVWGENIHVYPRSVDTHVSKLRKKLGPKAELVVSVHGSGYRFKGETAHRAPLRLDFGSEVSRLSLGHAG